MVVILSITFINNESKTYKTRVRVNFIETFTLSPILISLKTGLALGSSEGIKPKDW